MLQSLLACRAAPLLPVAVMPGELLHVAIASQAGLLILLKQHACLMWA